MTSRYGTAEHQVSASVVQSRLAEAFGKQLALFLFNLKLREVLQSQALHDPLTGLFNRRHMQDFLERSTASAQHKNHPIAVLMLDLDQFKTFNDTQGHLAGDDMLRFLGRFLQLHTRGDDVACRYGGDEFVLILPKAPLSVAVRRAKELAGDVDDAAAQHRLTVSLDAYNVDWYSSGSGTWLFARESVAHRGCRPLSSEDGGR